MIFFNHLLGCSCQMLIKGEYAPVQNNIYSVFNILKTYPTVIGITG